MYHIFNEQAEAYAMNCSAPEWNAMVARHVFINAAMTFLLLVEFVIWFRIYSCVLILRKCTVHTLMLLLNRLSNKSFRMIKYVLHLKSNIIKRKWGFLFSIYFLKQDNIRLSVFTTIWHRKDYMCLWLCFKSSRSSTIAPRIECCSEAGTPIRCRCLYLSLSLRFTFIVLFFPPHNKWCVEARIMFSHVAILQNEIQRRSRCFPLYLIINEFHLAIIQFIRHSYLM